MKSLAELEAIREKTKFQISLRKEHENDIKIFVGMGTCGIAAGAKDVVNAFINELSNKNIENVKVIATGCMSECELEPVVEVATADGNRTKYIHMNAEKAVKVVEDHIINNKVVTEYTLGSNN